MTSRVAQLEMECLKVLWSAPGATVTQVKERLPRTLAYTTVLTVLDRMAAKGLVTRQKHGRAYVYAAALEREAAREDAVSQLLANLFERDPQALVEYLASRSAPWTAAARRTAAAAPSRARAARRPPSGPRMDDVLL